MTKMWSLIWMCVAVTILAQHASAELSSIDASIDRRIRANVKDVIDEINSIGHMFHYRIAKFLKSVGEATKTMKLRANQFFEDAAKKHPTVAGQIKDANAKYEQFAETTKHTLDAIPQDVAGNLMTYRAIVNETVLLASRDIFLYGADLRQKLIAGFENDTKVALACTWQFAKKAQRFVRKYSSKIRHCANIQSSKITMVIDSSFSLLHNVKSYERNVLENFNRCFKAGKSKKLSADQTLLSECITFITNNLERGREIIREKAKYIEAKSESDVILSSESFVACTERIRKEDKEVFEEMKREIDTCLLANVTVSTTTAAVTKEVDHRPQSSTTSTTVAATTGTTHVAESSMPPNTTATVAVEAVKSTPPVVADDKKKI